MPYIGAKELKASDIRRFDVTSSTSATHTLTWTPPTEQSLIVTINGIKQHEDAYSVSGTTLTLSSPLVATDKLEVIGINDIGTTITPAQNSVDLDKLATTGTPSSSTFLRGDMAWGAVPTTGIVGVSIFTSSGTWTKATRESALSVTIKRVIVEVQGAGGGGGKGASGDYHQHGGGGGYAKKLLDVSGISSATITVGTGGASVSHLTTGKGGDGGNSSWSDGTNTITGGGGGGGDESVAHAISAGGTATGGDLNIPGQSQRGYTNTNAGNSFLGHGGQWYDATYTSTKDGQVYGGGGSKWSGYSVDTGSGANGIVIVTEIAG